MKKILSIFILVLISSTSYSQFAISAGPAALYAFGVQPGYLGLQVSGEVPIDDETAYYGKISFYSKHKGENSLIGVNAIDPMTSPNYMLINSYYSMNYTTIEGGRRYYFGNGYDYGFAPYGGTHLMAIFNTIKVNPDSYDKSKYMLDQNTELRGNSFSLAFGLTGGLKNDFAWGTLYIDGGFDYLIMNNSTNSTAQVGLSQFGSQLLFSISAGFKKIIF